MKVVTNLHTSKSLFRVKTTVNITNYLSNFHYDKYHYDKLLKNKFH